MAYSVRSIIKLFVNRIVSTNEQHDRYMNIMSYYTIYYIFLKITRVAHLHIGQERTSPNAYYYKYETSAEQHIFCGKNIR